MRTSGPSVLQRNRGEALALPRSRSWEAWQGTAFIAAVVLWLVLGVAGMARGEAPQEPAPGTKLGSLETAWLLEEFDWGDTEAIVRESVDYAPNYLCFEFRNDCRIVRVRIDSEDMIARFQYHDDALWRVAYVTPPLDQAQATEHGARVVTVLSNHVSRTHGTPDFTAPFPDLTTLVEGTQVLFHWKPEGMAIDVVVVRRGDQFFLGAYFADPVRGLLAQATAEDPTIQRKPPKRKRAGKPQQDR